MFSSARIKLTAWYLLIIMFVSLVFSVVLFVDANREIGRFATLQMNRRERLYEEFGLYQSSPTVTTDDTQLIDQARYRLILSLVFLNLCILVGSTIVGYFLAGRTLKPIQDMVDEQNRFIGDASHELKTPLTSLRSEIEVYLRSKKPSVIEANEILRSNLEEVVNLQNLSENLIMLSKYEELSYGNFSSEKVSLTVVLEKALLKVKGGLKKNNIKVKNNVSNINFLGNEAKLVQLFVIILDNAIKYSPPKTTITINSKISGNSAVVDIKDQGIGIDKKDVSKIFERFYRVDSARSKKDAEGFGLGLSIADKIVKSNKGKIFVKSTLNKGTTFTIQLPKKV